MTFTLTLHLLRRLWPFLAIPVVLLSTVTALFVLLIEPMGGVTMMARFVNAVPAISRMVEATGMDFTSRAGIAVGAYVHPFTAAMLALWALSVGVASLAGDVESGYADQVLSRAVPRHATLIASIITLFIGAVLIGAAMCLGTAIGAWLSEGTDPLPLRRFFLAGVQVTIIVAAMGSVAILVSTLSSDRGRVVAICAVLWLANYFNGKIAPIFESLQWLVPWSIEGHYRPVHTVNSGQIDSLDVVVLLMVVTACLGAAFWVWHRRDIQD